MIFKLKVIVMVLGSCVSWCVYLYVEYRVQVFPIILGNNVKNQVSMLNLGLTSKPKVQPPANLISLGAIGPDYTVTLHAAGLFRTFSHPFD